MSQADVDTTGFIELGRQPQLRPYLTELWSRREYAAVVPYHDLRVQRMNTLLGQFWHFLNPAMTFAVYYLIFGIILDAAGVSRGVNNYLGYLVIGILMYTMITRVMTDGLTSIPTNAGLIRSVDFPRALLPITATIKQILAFLPAAIVMMVALVITGERPSLRWLLFVPTLVATMMIVVGLALLLARAGAAILDLEQVISHVFRLLFYMSGVLFLPSRFITNDVALRIFNLNPIFDILAVSRWCLMDQPMDPEVPILLVFYALVFPVVGLIVFMRAEHRYAAS